MVLEWLWGDPPWPRAEKPQQDGRHWSSDCAALEPLWGDTPRPRAKEKPQQDGRRDEITFRNRSHNPPERLKGLKQTFCTPKTPQRLKQNCLWVFPVEGRVKSGLPQGQGFWVQQTWVWHKPSWRRSPLTSPYSRQNLHGTGKENSGRQKQNLVHTRTQEKGAMTPQETDLDAPMTV